jgi:hypothetical protein
VVTALAAWIGLHGVGVADAFRHAQLVFRAPVAAVRIAVTETGEDQVVVGGKRQAATDHAGEHWAIRGALLRFLARYSAVALVFVLVRIVPSHYRVSGSGGGM